MKPRVLIVDDSLTVRMDIGEALQSAGFDTVLCADLRSAREALAREGSGLIVLDILLPDGDGLGFLKELRISPATAQIPVLLLANEAEAGNRVREMGAGTAEYMGKPYDLGVVAARARALTQADVSGGVGLGRRVLLIDESSIFRNEFRQSLEGAGYHVDRLVRRAHSAAAFETEIDFGGMRMAMIWADLPRLPAGDRDVAVFNSAEDFLDVLFGVELGLAHHAEYMHRQSPPLRCCRVSGA